MTLNLLVTEVSTNAIWGTPLGDTANDLLDAVDVIVASPRSVHVEAANLSKGHLPYMKKPTNGVSDESNSIVTVAETAHEMPFGSPTLCHEVIPALYLNTAT